jgi:hypothetical protein
LHDRGVVWLARLTEGEEWPDCAINLDAAAATMLFDRCWYTLTNDQPITLMDG